MKKENKICSICGGIIEGEVYEVNGEIMCQECFDEHYFYCEDCGRVEDRDNGCWVEDAYKMVCEDCANGYSYCEDCGNYYERATYIQDYGYVCERCFDRGDYGYCEGCDNYFRGCDIRYSEYHDAYYCEDCYEEHYSDDELLYEYHDFNDWRLFKAPNEEEPKYYIGKEIELEAKNYNQLGNVIDCMNTYLNAVGMHDGSLDNGGAEIVTHPESWEYLQLKKQDYIDFFANMQRLEYGDAGHTGLHFHVSRPNDDIIARIIVIIESFKEEIKKLSRRNGDFGWSKFLSDSESNEKEKYKYQSTKYLKEDYLKCSHDRYLALNLNNSNTIEFRFFKGANNFEEFWGALQFIHNIMEIAYDETIEIDNINWQDLLVGDELKAQAQKYGVADVDKKAKDMTEIVEKIEKIKEDTKNEIGRVLKNFIKYITKEMEEKRLESISRKDINDFTMNSRIFIKQFENDLNYLDSINDIYRRLERNSVMYTKDSVRYVKENARYYNKEGKYERYFKELDKAFENYEREVA